MEDERSEYRYLMGLKDEYVLIDLINGMHLRDTLVNRDDNMTTRLRNVKVIPVENPPFHLDAFTLHGKTIKSHILEDDTKIDCLLKMNYPLDSSASTSGVRRRSGGGRGFRRGRFRARGTTVCAKCSRRYGRFSRRCGPPPLGCGRGCVRRGRPPKVSGGILKGCGSNLKGRGRPRGRRREKKEEKKTDYCGSERDDFGSKVRESDLIQSELNLTGAERGLMESEISSLKGECYLTDGESSLAIGKTNSSDGDWVSNGSGSYLSTGESISGGRRGGFKKNRRGSRGRGRGSIGRRRGSKGRRRGSERGGSRPTESEIGLISAEDNSTRGENSSQTGESSSKVNGSSSEIDGSSLSMGDLTRALGDLTTY